MKAIFSQFSLLISLFILYTGFTSKESKSPSPPLKIAITWTDSIQGDFSFVDSWQYPEGVYRNPCGQISCDGYCPDGVWQMKTKGGCFPKSKLKKLYSLLDTSHQYLSLSADALCYEYAGSDFFDIKHSGDTLIGQSRYTVGTHSSLIFVITGDSCLPSIHYNSVRKSVGTIDYHCISGYLRIDKHLFQKGILKAEFDLHFYDDFRKERDMYWKGKILTKIKQK